MGSFDVVGSYFVWNGVMSLSSMGLSLYMVFVLVSMWSLSWCFCGLLDGVSMFYGMVSLYGLWDGLSMVYGMVWIGVAWGCGRG